jgi:hypothetical protein
MKQVIFILIYTLLVCTKANADDISLNYLPEINFRNISQKQLTAGNLNFDINIKKSNLETVIDLTTPELDFNYQNFPELKEKISRPIGGTITTAIKATINNSNLELKKSAEINMKGLTFDSKSLSISNLNTYINIDNFSPLEIKETKISSPFVFWKKLKIFNFDVTFSLNKDYLTIHSSKGKLKNGLMYIEPSTTEVSNEKVIIPLKIERMPIQAFLNLGNKKDISSSGTLSGRIPITYNVRTNKLSINNGALFSDDKGFFSYTDSDNNTHKFNFNTLQFFIKKDEDKGLNVRTMLRGYPYNKTDPAMLNLNISPIFERLFK